MKNIKFTGKYENIQIAYTNELCTSDPEVIEVSILFQSLNEETCGKHGIQIIIQLKSFNRIR
jgi:hypothetical protein